MQAREELLESRICDQAGNGAEGGNCERQACPLRLDLHAGNAERPLLFLASEAEQGRKDDHQRRCGAGTRHFADSQVVSVRFPPKQNKKICPAGGHLWSKLSDERRPELPEADPLISRSRARVGL